MSINSEIDTTYQIIFSNQAVEVRWNHQTGHHGLFSRQVYLEQQLITPFSAEQVFRKPSYLTIQLSDRRHISLLPNFLQYVNHSCNPSCFFDTTKLQFIALKEIHPGDELTFFYPSTEWRMARAFACRCGEPQCLGVIQGASQTPFQILGNYQLSEFIRKKLLGKERQ